MNEGWPFPGWPQDDRPSILAGLLASFELAIEREPPAPTRRGADHYSGGIWLAGGRNSRRAVGRGEGLRSSSSR